MGKPLRSIFLWTFYLAVSGLVILFAVSNREVTGFSLYPLPYTLEIPKFLFVILLFILGFAAGSFMLWIPSLRLKHKIKADGKRIEALENEVAALRAERSVTPTPPAPGLPSQAA